MTSGNSYKILESINNYFAQEKNYGKSKLDSLTFKSPGNFNRSFWKLKRTLLDIFWQFEIKLICFVFYLVFVVIPAMKLTGLKRVGGSYPCSSVPRPLRPSPRWPTKGPRAWLMSTKPSPHPWIQSKCSLHVFMNPESSNCLFDSENNDYYDSYR